MELNLILAKGEPRGKVISADKDSLVIGRQDDCDLVISSAKVSRQHCRIDVTGDTASLTDLGSANGTFLNGQKVTSAKPLSAGDKVVVGPLGFVVEIDGNRGAPPADLMAGIEDDIIQLSENDLLES